jgi:Spy/CpxP family protein refolding chaperone
MDARRHMRGTGRAGLPHWGARGGLAVEMVLRHADDLKLTDAQVESLEGLAGETRKKLVDLHAEIQKSEIEIQSLIRSESGDLARINRHIEAASKARARIQEERIALLFDVRKILTPEQKEMLKEEFPRLGRIVD